MNNIQILAELGFAVGVALAVVRHWRQILAAAAVVMVALGVIGLVTVLSWFDAGPRWW